MMFDNNVRTEDKDLLSFINDVRLYWHLFGGNGFSVGVAIKKLPYSKSYFEHPYWVISKMNYILDMINKVLNEKHDRESKKGGK